MENDELKRLAVEKTLKSMNRAPKDWITTNTRVHTHLINESYQFKSNVVLHESEKPILECILEDSSFLITTQRVFSRDFIKWYELPIKMITGLNDKGAQTKDDVTSTGVNTIEVKNELQREFFLNVDSLYPAFFTKILILNLSSFVRYGKWYLDI